MKTVVLSIILLTTVVAALPMIPSNTFYAAEWDDNDSEETFYFEESQSTESEANLADILPWLIDTRSVFSSDSEEPCRVRCPNKHICLYGECRIRRDGFRGGWL